MKKFSFLQSLPLAFVLFASPFFTFAATKASVKKPGMPAAPVVAINTTTNKTLNQGINSIESFRIATYKEILTTTTNTQKEIDTYSKSSSSASQKPLDGTREPILYIKLFLFLVLGFIFGNQVIFYVLFALIIFILLRFIYRKIRHK